MSDIGEVRLGVKIFGVHWPMLRELQKIKKINGCRVKISVAQKIGQPRPQAEPIMTTFTGSENVMLMHPCDFAWFLFGSSQRELAHAASMKAIQFMIDYRAALAVLRLERMTKTEWNQYMEDIYGEGWNDDDEEAA